MTQAQARTSTELIRSAGTDLQGLRFDLIRDFPDDLSRFPTMVAQWTFDDESSPDLVRCIAICPSIGLIWRSNLLSGGHFAHGSGGPGTAARTCPVGDLNARLIRQTCQ